MSEAAEWVSNLPEVLQDMPYLTEADTPEVFKQRVVDAAAWMGNSVRMPGEDASAEDKTAFRNKILERDDGLMLVPVESDDVSATFRKLGTPEKPENYKTPEGIEMDATAMGKIKAMAHKANMTQDQFSRYIADVHESTSTANNEAQQAHGEAIAALKSEWGASYDQRTKSITAFLKSNSTTPPGIVEALEAETLPAEQVRWLHSLAEAVANEDTEFHQQQKDANVLISPMEAREQIEEINKRLVTEASTLTGNERKNLTVKLLRLQHMAEGNKPPSDAELLRLVGG